MSILVRRKNGAWKDAALQPFPDENQLQQMLYNSPELIPVRGGPTVAKVFIRECGLPGSGYTDLLGVDSTGEIYVVECKLATNPEIRREVIGQILEYAAYLWEMSFEAFDDLFQKKGKMKLSKVLAERAPFGWDFDVFRSNVSRNLAAGNLNLLIAVDQMNQQLEEIISYLAGRGVGIRLQAIELKVYSHEDFEILAPELHGQLATTPGTNGHKQIARDYESFFEDAKRKLKPEEVAILDRLYQTSKGYDLTWGTGATSGSFNVRIDGLSKRSIYSGTSNGKLIINFGNLNDSSAATVFRDKLKRRLEGVSVLQIPENYQQLWPAFPIEKWGPVADEFIQAIYDLSAEIVRPG
jgi:hypothetical protein